MDMMETHKKCREGKEHIIKHEFMAAYKENGKIIYGFVEGKDDICFYQNFIESMLSEEWELSHLWHAGGKKRVLNIFNNLDWTRFKKGRVIFL